MRIYRQCFLLGYIFLFCQFSRSGKLKKVRAIIQLFIFICSKCTNQLLFFFFAVDTLSYTRKYGDEDTHTTQLSSYRIKIIRFIYTKNVSCNAYKIIKLNLFLIFVFLSLTMFSTYDKFITWFFRKKKILNLYVP